ncbi:MAG: VOC family protein [Planctomycetota bacterium]
MGQKDQRLTPSVPPIGGVSEVVLNVDDIQVMRDFYQEVLGFEVNREACFESEKELPNGKPTIVFLKIADLDSPLGRHQHPQLLALIDYKRHVWAKRFRNRDPLRSGLNHLAFEIPPGTCGEYLKHLAKWDLETSTTDFPSMSAEAIFFDDPEGNRIELIAHRL